MLLRTYLNIEYWVSWLRFDILQAMKAASDWPFGAVTADSKSRWPHGKRSVFPQCLCSVAWLISLDVTFLSITRASPMTKRFLRSSAISLRCSRRWPRPPAVNPNKRQREELRERQRPWRLPRRPAARTTAPWAWKPETSSNRRPADFGVCCPKSAVDRSVVLGWVVCTDWLGLAVKKAHSTDWRCPVASRASSI